MKEKESDIQKSIIDYLTMKGHFFWRNNSGATKMPNGRFVHFGLAGSPDIILIKDGWFVGLEVKTKGGRLSASQKEFQKKCSEHGAEYYVVRSIDDVQEIGL